MFRTRLLLVLILLCCSNATSIDKASLRKQAHDMFMHGYNSYMKYAYPADELMPLSCKGRYRGITPSRGDVDDSLGNFSLTLVDTLDTLFVVGEIDEFERAVKLVVDNVKLDSDVIVSVFETNIRMVGGLISAHLMAELVRANEPARLSWYTDRQLLKMATELGRRLLPAFNTTSGLPYSRINLKYGMIEHLKRQKDTCTACGGTMLLEFAALSRLTGDPIFEEKAKKAMDFLWLQRHRSSDLMGTVLNVHSGDWVRRDSGIGAGIDSYYEYCLKAYILLGETSYLDRFNKHYDAVMRYVNKGPYFVDVHMHRPNVATRSFMDALLAFWPGLQVLKGDVEAAIELHEMLFQVVKKHKFLPEAFTHDFQVHWAEHPLRPEFIESTYFLYRATRDPHYLEVAKQVMDSLDENVRVPCGFAGVKDVRTMSHEDRMDSFVLSETFKYLYMIFTEHDDLPLDPDNYVLTTEAHFLPLSMAELRVGETAKLVPRKIILDAAGIQAVENSEFLNANPMGERSSMREDDPRQIREKTKSVIEEMALLQAQHSQSGGTQSERLRAWAFSATNAAHLKQLKEMGIDIQVQEDGRLQLSHHGANELYITSVLKQNKHAEQLEKAKNPEYAKWGYEFMQEVVEMAAKLNANTPEEGRLEYFVQLLGYPHLGLPVLQASPAQFGRSLEDYSVEAEVIIAEPLSGCSSLLNGPSVKGKVVGVMRGDCMFQEKARSAQQSGAVAVIVIDNQPSTSAEQSAPFAMSRDQKNKDDIEIPVVFLFRKEGDLILNSSDKELFVRITMKPYDADSVVASYLRWGPRNRKVEKRIEKCSPDEGYFIRVEPPGDAITFQFRLQGIGPDHDPVMHQAIVERHVGNLRELVEFSDPKSMHNFLNLMRTAAYGAMGINVQDENLQEALKTLKDLKLRKEPSDIHAVLPGGITKVRCQPIGDIFGCTTLN